MTINERVKHFRKDVLHISQTELINCVKAFTGVPVKAA